MKQSIIDEYRSACERCLDDIYTALRNANERGSVDDTNKVYISVGSTYPGYRHDNGVIYIASDGPKDRYVSVTWYRNLERGNDNYFIPDNEKEEFEKTHTVVGEIKQEDYDTVSKQFVFDILRYGNEEAIERIKCNKEITDGLIEAARLLTKHNVPVEKQRRIFREGSIRFTFDDDTVTIDCLQLGRFLKFIEYTRMDIDVNKMLHDINTCYVDSEYEPLVRLFVQKEEKEKEKQKVK